MDTIKINSKGVKMVAHRGVSGIERENTCAAFIAAGNRSYFGVECDVHITKDGKFVIIHDNTTKRITLEEYDINVEENNYSAIENIVLPDLDGTALRKDLKIPLLKEYIMICKKYEKKCVLEVKNHFEVKHLKKMVEEIRETGWLENVIFISFDFENCVNLRKLLPDSTIQFLIPFKEDIIGEELIKKLCDNKLDIDSHYKNLNKEVIEKLHLKGIKVNAYTCDAQETAEKLIAWGIDFITTNILE